MIKKNLSPLEINQLKKIGNPGIVFLNSQKRVYPQHNIFSHLVELEEDYGNNYDSRKTAEGTFKNLSMSYMKEKMENGLLGFLNDFIRNNVTLNNLIESEFNFNT